MEVAYADLRQNAHAGSMSRILTSRRWENDEVPIARAIELALERIEQQIREEMGIVG